MERQILVFTGSQAVPSDDCLFQLNKYRSAISLNGMIGIGDQVHHDLMHLRGISGGKAAIHIDMACDFNIHGYRGPDQLQCLFQNLLNPDGLFKDLGLTAESQDLFDQITATLRGFENLFRNFMRGTLRWNIFL